MSIRIPRSRAGFRQRRDPVWIALGALLVTSFAITLDILVAGAFLHPLLALFHGS